MRWREASNSGGLAERISSAVMPCSSSHCTSSARSARAVPSSPSSRSSMFRSPPSSTTSTYNAGSPLRAGVLKRHLGSAAPDGFDVAESGEVFVQTGGDSEQISVVTRCDAALAVAQSTAGGGSGGGSRQHLCRAEAVPGQIRQLDREHVMGLFGVDPSIGGQGDMRTRIHE